MASRAAYVHHAESGEIRLFRCFYYKIDTALYDTTHPLLASTLARAGILIFRQDARVGNSAIYQLTGGLNFLSGYIR